MDPQARSSARSACRLPFVVAVMAGLAAAGCSGGHAHLEAELDRMKDELVRIQADNGRLDERVMALEET